MCPRVKHTFYMWSSLCAQATKEYTCACGFPGGTSGKEPTCQCGRQKRYVFDPWVGKIPWKRAWQLTPVFLPGEFHGQRTWWAAVQGVTKSLIGLKWLSTTAYPGFQQMPWAGKHGMLIEYTNEWRELGRVRGHNLECLLEPARPHKWEKQTGGV